MKLWKDFVFSKTVTVGRNSLSLWHFLCFAKLLLWFPFILAFVTGKVYSLDENSSLGSIDSEYDMGSIQREIKFLEDTPSLKEMVLTNQQAPRITPPFIGLRPANPAMQALTSQKRETHNRSPVSFREGRRASDTSLTQGNDSPWRDACLDVAVHVLHTQEHQALPCGLVVTQLISRLLC